MSGFEEGLWRVYERTMYAMVGMPGILSEPMVAARTARARSMRKVNKWCQGLLTTLAVVLIFLLSFMVLAHFSFLGKGNGTCLITKLNNNTLPKDIILRLQFGTSMNPVNDSNLMSNFVPEYEFSRMGSFIAMNNIFREKHLVETINITLGDECISSPLLAWMIGHDTVIINQLLFAFGTGGSLHNLETNEFWSWTDSQVEKRMDSYLFSMNTLWNLIEIPLDILISFFLVTCITSMLIRILLSSGVIIVYPVLYCGMKLCRNQQQQHEVSIEDTISSIFRVAYPWLGGQIAQLHARGRSVWPLVIAHVSRVFVYWSVYQACQFVWSMWFFNKSVPAGMTDWCYGLFMLVEYYVML